MVNGFMKNRVNRAFMAKKKKQYSIPFSEVAEMQCTGALLSSPVTHPTPPIGPGPSSAPARRTEVF